MESRDDVEPARDMFRSGSAHVTAWVEFLAGSGAFHVHMEKTG